MHRHALTVLLLAAALSACSGEPPASSYEAVDALLEEQRWSEAAAELEERAGDEGLTPELALRLGLAHHRSGNPARAFVVYRDALEQHPESAALLVRRGEVRLELMRFEDALADFRAAREAGASDAAVALLLGTCLGQLGRIDEAAEEFERARAAGVDGVVLDYNQGLLRANAGQLAEAQALFQAVLDARPEHHAAQRELARTLIKRGAAGDPELVEQGIDLAWDARDAQPDDWRSHEVLGDGMMAVGDWTAAVEAYTKALETGRNPKVVEEKYVLAETRRREAEERSLAEEGSASGAGAVGGSDDDLDG